MGACTSFSQTHIESQESHVEDKLQFLNSCTIKSTKFSSLKNSKTMPSQIQLSNLIAIDEQITDMDEDKEVIKIHCNIKQKKERHYNFQEEIEIRSPSIRSYNQKRASSSPRKSRKKTIHRKADSLSPLLQRRENRLAQFLDISEYIQLLNNSNEFEKQSPRSILKQKSQKSMRSMRSMQSSQSSQSQKKVKFAKGTIFYTISKSQQFKKPLQSQ